MDVAKEKDERPAWQIEAEKCKAARQGGYIDPEKAKLEKRSTRDNQELTKIGNGDMKRMTPQEIQKQLSEIDNKLTDLEVRGRQLEESIGKDHGEEEDEGMMIEWFTLVNDKNELVRTEADLIYISKTQELEDEQQRIDRELRRLLNKSEELRTAEDQEREEQLIQRLVDLVNQRSLIVDCQDEDRIRYEEEDRDIAEILSKKEFCKRPSVSEDSHEHMKKNSKES